MLAVILMGMTFAMLYGARGLITSGDGGDASVDILGSEKPEDDGSIPSVLGSTTTSVPATTTTIEPTTTTSAAVTHPPSEVTTRVGNGAERGGVAGAGTNILASAGYITLSPKNAETIDVSTIYFTEGYSEDAKLVAQLMGVADTNVVPMPANPGMPVGDANVVAVMGRDTNLGR